LVVIWFERAWPIAAQIAVQSAAQSLENKKLSTVYKFVRGMPMLILDGYQSQKITTRCSRKRGLGKEGK